MREALADMLIVDEGLRLKVYDDHNGEPIKKGTKVEKYPTIGVGRNVAKDGLGISQEEAEFMLMNDIERVEEEIKNFPIEHLNEARRAIIIDMAFNMGITRFNPTMWKKMFTALANEDYGTASKEMLDSNWARQTKRRSKRLSDMMLLGDWIEE